MSFCIKDLPKVELHVHLDCCLSFKGLSRIDPTISESFYKKNFIGTSCSCLKDYIRCADTALEYMQTKEQLEIVIEDLFDQLTNDNVIYAEIRFAPLLHQKKGLSSKNVVEIVSNKTKIESEKSGIEVGLILCTLRHFSVDQSLQTVKLVKDFSNKNVVGFDIAADEAGFPIDNHIKSFQFAKDNNIFCTAHAGEALGADSVTNTLKYLKPNRIGHGVRCIEDNSLIEKIKKENIHLEICVTSNIVTKVFNNLKDHPVNFLLNKGISLSINTDGRTISDTTLNKEYVLLNKEFNWLKNKFLEVNVNAMKASFSSNEVKNKIISILNQNY
ncbi:MAG: adenosine deaminase [Flavobacteriales bacterium]|nr:MAG: adenosine deaminase [Flavobacteriales bacterium]